MVGLYSGGLYLGEDSKREKGRLSEKTGYLSNNYETRVLEVAGYKREFL
jgi:hypothetical protein